MKTMFNINNTYSENQCSIKPSTKAITSAFKLFHKQIETYTIKSRYFSEVNTFWVVKSNN